VVLQSKKPQKTAMRGKTGIGTLGIILATLRSPLVLWAAAGCCGSWAINSNQLALATMGGTLLSQHLRLKCASQQCQIRVKSRVKNIKNNSIKLIQYKGSWHEKS
jgi:hypothetical protein